MSKLCSLCGARIESTACTNSLCRGFGQKASSSSLKTKRPENLSEQSQVISPAEPCDSPQGTTIRRHIAGVLDNLLAWFLAVVCTKSLALESAPWIQISVAVLSFLVYFFAFEALFCTTPGKFLNGLVVRDFAGKRCTISQTLVRTLFRLIEVNPVIGALPAAACILLSKNKQRLGDRVAGTVVVLR